MSNVTNTEEDAIVSRWRFEKEITTFYGGRSKKPEWSKERIKVVIRLIEEFDAALETKQLRNSTHYYYAKNYEILEEGGRKCLIQKRKDIDDPRVKIVPVEEYYDVLDEVHRSTGHGGRDKMLMALKYVCFIPTPAVLAFVKSCQTCQRRKAAFKKGPIFLTRAMDVFSNRGLVKIIDMQLTPDERYEWILHYQDCSTKFSFLRPLTSNDATEVASELLKIFLEIGCPAILQIENSREYTTDVLKELASLWPSCKILNGRPVPQPTSPSTDLIENVYVQLTAWMRDNSSCSWAKGLYFVQFQKNCTYHPCVQQTPYKALFGCDPKIGMQSKCPADLLSKICLEEDLECELNRKSVNDIQHLLIESSSSCVQAVEYENPFSNVCLEVLLPESHNKVPAVLLEHSVQIKKEYDDTTGKETMHDVTTEVNVKSEGNDTTTDESMNKLTPPSLEASIRQLSSTHQPILCAICGEKTVPTHSCFYCHRIIHVTCGISSFESPTLLCPTCHKDPTKNTNKRVESTTKIVDDDVILVKSEGEDIMIDEPMNEPSLHEPPHHTYELMPPAPEASMLQSSSTHKPILCAVCGKKTIPTHSCDSCHKIMHDTCGITSLKSPKILLCPSCHIDSAKIIKTEYDDTTGNETMHDLTTEENIKSESDDDETTENETMHDLTTGENIKSESDDNDTTENETMHDITTEENIKNEDDDTTTDEPINELTPPSLEASIRQLSSTQQPILCAVCGEKTVPSHSCVFCHRIIHVTCGISSFESPTLLCPTCHKDPTKIINTRNALTKKIDDDDVILVENPEVSHHPVVPTWRKIAPAINLKRNLTVINKIQQKEPKIMRVKRFGYSTVRCRCKQSEKQCSSQRCICQTKNQACTTNCHNPLQCNNQLKVISK